MRNMILATCLLIASGGAMAATNTGSIAASGTAVPSCIVNSATLDFGSLPGVVRTNKDVTGNISLQCSSNTAYTIYANQGLNETGGSRAMAGPGTAKLKYQLFADGARTKAIDASTTGIAGTMNSTGGNILLYIYGRIPTGQAVDAGSFADTVGLTVQF